MDGQYKKIKIKTKKGYYHCGKCKNDTFYSGRIALSFSNAIQCCKCNNCVAIDFIKFNVVEVEE